MDEKSLTLQVPIPLAREAEAAGQDLLVAALERGLQELRIDRVLESYRRGGISFGAAAERAGISQSDLARHAYARGMEPPFSTELLALDVS